MSVLVLRQKLTNSNLCNCTDTFEQYDVTWPILSEFRARHLINRLLVITKFLSRCTARCTCTCYHVLSTSWINWYLIQVVLLFLRRFGWRLCRYGCQEMSKLKPILLKHNVRLVAIGMKVCRGVSWGVADECRNAYAMFKYATSNATGLTGIDSISWAEKHKNAMFYVGEGIC